MFFTQMDDALFTAKTGVATISIANTDLNGDGAMEPVIAAGQYGTMINTIRIKAIEPVSAGMVRLFIGDVETKYLWIEVRVMGIKPSENSSTFSRVLVFPRGSFILQADQTIYASTELSQTFNVIAEGMDWDYS